MCGNQSCSALASVLSEEDRVALILPLFLELAADTNWQVRYTTISHIRDICELFPREIITTHLLPEFTRLLEDTELEVRACAAGAVSQFCKFINADVIGREIIPLISKLREDPSEHVRVALSSNVLSKIMRVMMVNDDGQ